MGREDDFTIQPVAARRLPHALLNTWTIMLAGAACALGLIVGSPDYRAAARGDRAVPRGAPVLTSASDLCDELNAGTNGYTGLRSGKRCGPLRFPSPFSVPRRAVRLVGYVSSARTSYEVRLRLRRDSNLNGDGGDSPTLKEWTLSPGSRRRIDYRLSSERGGWLVFEASIPALYDGVAYTPDGAVLFRNLRIIGKRR